MLIVAIEVVSGCFYVAVFVPFFEGAVFFVVLEGNFFFYAAVGIPGRADAFQCPVIEFLFQLDLAGFIKLLVFPVKNAFAVVFARVRTVILERERGAAWTAALLPGNQEATA